MNIVFDTANYIALLYCVQVIFFGGGWVFFLKKLFRDYEVSYILIFLTFMERPVFFCSVLWKNVVASCIDIKQ